MIENYSSEILQSVQLEEQSFKKDTSLYGLPLSPTEYRRFFEVINVGPSCNSRFLLVSSGYNYDNCFLQLDGENIRPEAEYLSNPYNANR